MFGEGRDRSETVLIRIDLDKKAWKRHKTDIRTVMPTAPEIEDGDMLKFKYEFNIRYYGDIVEHFEAIGRVVEDESLVKDIKIDELIHGRSVIIDIVQKLTRIIDTLEGR